MLNERRPVDERRRIEPLSRPGQPFAAKRKRGVTLPRNRLMKSQEFGGGLVSKNALQPRPGQLLGPLDGRKLLQ